MSIAISEHKPYGESRDCIHLSNGHVELYVSTDFGPRILHYGLAGDDLDNNVFGRWDGIQATTELGDWRIRGGHRLWIAPEDSPKSYEPDNDPVPYKIVGDTIFLLPEREKTTHIRKEIEIAIAENGSRSRSSIG